MCFLFYPLESFPSLKGYKSHTYKVKNILKTIILKLKKEFDFNSLVADTGPAN